jgi:pimeloyl-ACP methyl ester carboxylesterase
MMQAGIGLVALGFVAMNALAYRHARSMLRFSSAGEKTGKPETLSVSQKLKVLLNGVDLPRPRTSVSVEALGPDARSVRIPVAESVQLGGWYRCQQRGGPLVIFLHGYASEKSGLLPEALAFLELGYSVLLIDFRGSGESSEAYTTIGLREAEDVVGAARFGREVLGHSRCVLYGQSMGAAAVLCAIARHGLKVDGIIIESVFDRLSTTVKHRFEAMGLPSFPFAQLLLGWGSWQMGFNGFLHNPVDYARNVTCPALFLHGAADPRARIEEARAVFRAISGPRVMQEFPQLGHASSIEVFPEQWSRAVTAFLSTIPNL